MRCIAIKKVDHAHRHGHEGSVSLKSTLDREHGRGAGGRHAVVAQLKILQRYTSASSQWRERSVTNLVTNGVCWVLKCAEEIPITIARTTSSPDTKPRPSSRFFRIRMRTPSPDQRLFRRHVVPCH